LRDAAIVVGHTIAAAHGINDGGTNGIRIDKRSVDATTSLLSNGLMKPLRENHIRRLESRDERLTHGHIDLQLRRRIAKAGRCDDGWGEGLGAGANAACEGDYEEKSVLHGMKDDRLRIMGEDKKGEWRMENETYEAKNSCAV
jgi:hypothetical protein